MDQIVLPPKTLQCGDLLQNINMALNKNFVAISDLITQEENERNKSEPFQLQRDVTAKSLHSYWIARKQSSLFINISAP